MSEESSQQSNSEVCLEVSKALFSNNAIMRAAHRLTADCYIAFTELPEKVSVRIRPKPSNNGRDWEGEFLNDLLDEELREKITAETAGERKLIMAHALSKQPSINRRFHTAPAFSIPRGELIGR